MPNRISPMEYTYMPTLLYLEEHKVLLCANENVQRKVTHHLTCWVMTDKEGSLERGPSNTLVDSFQLTYGMVQSKLPCCLQVMCLPAATWRMVTASSIARS